MKQFIEVTSLDGKSLVNVNHIIAVAVIENETYLYLRERKEPIKLTESYEDVKSLMAHFL